MAICGGKMAVDLHWWPFASSWLALMASLREPLKPVDSLAQHNYKCMNGDDSLISNGTIIPFLKLFRVAPQQLNTCIDTTTSAQKRAAGTYCKSHLILYYMKPNSVVRCCAPFYPHSNPTLTPKKFNWLTEHGYFILYLTNNITISIKRVMFQKILKVP